MTEADWYNADDPQAMLTWLREQRLLSGRKARLFAVAVCRRIWPLLPDEPSREAVGLAERYADGSATEEELLDPWPSGPVLDAWTLGLLPPGALDTTHPDSAKVAGSARDAARLCAAKEQGAVGLPDIGGQVAYYAAGAVAWKAIGAAKSAAEAEPWAAAWNRAEAGEYREQAALLRDLYNPLHSTPFNPAWRAPAAVDLARLIYAEQRFDLMPVLGAALSDAGCTDAAVLGHAIATTPHVRGCWVVDALLGKE